MTVQGRVQGFAGNSDVDRIRESTDLIALIGEHVSLRPRGREHVGLCPFHDDHKPSMAVVTHKGNAFYKCHACGAAGDCFRFVMDYHKRTFREALEFLAARAGIKLQAQQGGDRGEKRGAGAGELRAANAFAAEYFRKALRHPAAGEAARAMLARRGISEEMIEQFQIGFAPDSWDGLTKLIAQRGHDAQNFMAAGLLRQRREGAGHYDYFRNRLIFPICDDLGHAIAFGGRQMDGGDEPKYLNSPETAVFHKSSTLYGMHAAKRAIIAAGHAIIVEGYIDVIACHQAGVCNAVATLGTALTSEHAKVLGRLCDRVILVFDGDEAGQKAADRGLEVFFASPIDVKICVLPDGMDPDDLLRIDGGRARFDEALAKAVDALQFKVNRFQARLADAGTPTVRARRLTEFLRELADLGFGRLQGVRKRLVLTQLASLLGVSEADIERDMPRPARRPAVAIETKAEPNANEAPAVQRTFADSAEAAQGIIPARRRAEHEFLATLIFEPSAAAELMHEPGAEPVWEEHTPEGFADPPAGQIAGILLARLASGRSCAMQDLFGECDDPAVRALIAELYDQGARLCESGDSAAANLREASATLSRWKARQLPKRTTALNEVLQRRREFGHDPLALPRGVREVGT